MSLGERTGVTYKGRCTETSKNALSRIWRVEGDSLSPSSKSSAAEQTAMGQRHWARRGGGSSFHGAICLPWHREVRQGMPPALSSLKLLLTFNHALLPQGKRMLKNEESTLSLTRLCSHSPRSGADLAFLFSFFFLLPNKLFLSLQDMAEISKLMYLPTGSDYSLFLFCLIRTLHIT